MFITCTSGVCNLDGSQWKVDTNNPKLEAYIMEKVTILVWIKQPQPQSWGSNNCIVSCFIVFFMQFWSVKLNGWQWKNDTNNCFVERSICMNHWEISCLGMFKTATTTKLRVNNMQINQIVSLSHAHLVCEN